MHRIPILILLIVPFIATCYGVYQLLAGQVATVDIVLLITLAVLTEYGVTLGYHRMVVHKSFEPHPALKAIVLMFGSMAWQGPVINWASVHTKHHAHSDQEGDPHSPTISGFLYAHFEWLLEMSSPNMQAIRDKWGGRYAKDPVIVWFSKTFAFWSVFGLLLPAAIGGLVTGTWEGAVSALVWGGLIRIFVTSHVTWSVNSVCHYFGGRMFVTTDKSRNNPVVGLLALGEGWHNNHHAFPSSAFHGLRWWQIDITGMSIWVYEKLGLARKVVRIPASLQEKRRQDGQQSAVIVQDLALTED